MIKLLALKIIWATNNKIIISNNNNNRINKIVKILFKSKKLENVNIKTLIYIIFKIIKEFIYLVFIIKKSIYQNFNFLIL